MRVDVLTLFPALVDLPLSASIVGRARQTGALDLQIHDIRTWTSDVHRTADDTPYGGGAGMVLKVEPIVAGVEWIIEQHGQPERMFILSASGQLHTQRMAEDIAARSHIILICGHYEGIDDRVRIATGAEELSIGNYVLTGGELAAAVLVDSIARLLPGVINAKSIAEESHSQGLVEYPQYTRPAVYRDLRVPDVLVSGNHAEIRKWRREQAIARTIANRPDLLPDHAGSDHVSIPASGSAGSAGEHESR